MPTKPRAHSRIRDAAKIAAVRVTLVESMGYFRTFITLANLSAATGMTGVQMAQKITDALTQHGAILQRAIEDLDA